MIAVRRALSPAERIAALRLVALALRSPTAETLSEVELLAGVLAAREGSLPGTDSLERAAAGPVAALAAAHERLFGGQVSVPPYEGSYEPDPFRQARAMADVAGFYRAFGAEAHGPASDRPDHAGAELEFLAFVEARRAEAEGEGRAADAAACEEAQRLFLAEHAGRWLPVFFAALGGAAEDAFHRALAVVGTAVVAELVDRLRVDPTPVAGRSPRGPLEADELTCAGGDDVAVPGLAP